MNLFTTLILRLMKLIEVFNFQKFHYHFNEKPYNNRMTDICLCMIVNNEEHVIERCLNSVFQYIKFWVINDNGSTDKTPEIITNFFKQKGIPGILNRDGWKGFSHNRSLVFQIAEKESGCDWMYVIDADDYLQTPLFIPQYPPSADSFIINLQEGPNVMQTRQQLFKIGKQWGYAAVVHEYPYSKPYDQKKLVVGKTTDITVRASRGGARNQDPLKYWKDAIAMMKDLVRLRKIPKDKLPHWEKNLESRYCYYICQSWHDFGRYDYAIKWADERVKHVGFKEEVFRAYLLKARCMRKLQYPQDKIISAIQDCINYDKFRAEGYFEMAHQYVQHEQWEKAWEWIKPTMKMKRPTDKLFIVEDFTYEFGAKKEASWVAAKLGYYFDSYKIADDLCNTYSIDKRYRSWAYNIKHQNIPHILEFTTQYHKNHKNIKNSSKQNVVVNFNKLQSDDIDTAIKSLSSFLNCTTDSIKVDQWYCSSNDPKLLQHFPFLQVGKGSGNITLNLFSNFYFFHKCDLISEIQSYVLDSLKQDNVWAKKQLEKAIKKKNQKQIQKFKKLLEKENQANQRVENDTFGVKPKIIYLNRYGKEDLFVNELPDLFDTAASTARKNEQQRLAEQSKQTAQLQRNRKMKKGEKRVKIVEYNEDDFNQKLVQMEGVTKSPHVVFKEGEGIWSLERISCVDKDTKFKEYN